MLLPVPSQMESEVILETATTVTMTSFISDIVTPVATFVAEQVTVVGNLILENPILGMTFGIFLLGAAVGILSRLMRTN